MELQPVTPNPSHQCESDAVSASDPCDDDKLVDQSEQVVPAVPVVDGVEDPVHMTMPEKAVG